MSENTNLTGQVKIADEVIASIASTAVLESDGVAGLGGLNDLTGRLRGKAAKKGVSLTTDGQNVQITVGITVKSGVKIQDVALDVQQKVKTAIETMTGFTAIEVNVQVVGLVA